MKRELAEEGGAREESSALLKVLVVGKEKRFPFPYALLLQGKAQVLEATSLEEVERLFGEHQDLACIVIGEPVPNLAPLVRRMRETFRGPIIAATSSTEDAQELMMAGCSHSVQKYEVPELIQRLLKLR